jgi:hypothetical protein
MKQTLVSSTGTGATTPSRAELMSPWIPTFERPAPPLIDREAPRPTLFEPAGSMFAVAAYSADVSCLWHHAASLSDPVAPDGLVGVQPKSFATTPGWSRR